MTVGRVAIAALFLVAALLLVVLGLEYLVGGGSEDVGRAPFVIVGSISAAAGLALGGMGVLILRRRHAASRYRGRAG